MAQPWFERALTSANARRFQEALGHVDRELAQTPDDPDSLALKAALLNELDRAEEALPLFARAIALAPGVSSTHSNLGAALGKLGRRRAAIESFDRALTLQPDNPLALCNRGGQWALLGQHDKALADADRAIALRPGLAVAHRQRSLALQWLGRLEDALTAIDAALALDESNADTHERRASLLSALGRESESAEAFDRAHALNPASAGFLFARALRRLRASDFAGGWADYEARWRYDGFLTNSTNPAYRPFLARLNLEAEAAELVGRRVLLIDEQGLGDQVMFASILPDLLAVGAQVTCVCDFRLLALLSQSFPQADFRAAGAITPPDLAAFDLVMGLCGLGRVFRKRAEDFPGRPFLHARPATVDAWRARLGPPSRRLRVGLSWRGGLDKTGSPLRSLTLEALRPLLTRDDCEFVSLQYGEVEDEVAQTNAGLPHPIRLFPAAEIRDFEPLSGLVAALDLVVSVQTALIHLCGALGAPCLAMVPSVPEWRYGAEGPSMPWYGSVKLFRQSRRGDWAGVVAAVSPEIDRRIASAA